MARTGSYAYTCSCSTTGFVNSSPYANGQRVTSANSGASWTADTTTGGRDLSFRLFINNGYSPTGTLISPTRDGNPEIYVANRDGSRVRRVSGPGYAAVPTWAPDSRRLAFVRAEPNNPKVWKEMVDAGVDWINADRLKRFRKFMEKRK